MMDFDHSNLEVHLRNYYHRFYPHELIVKWLSYAKENGSLSNREFAFIRDDSPMKRFLSFNNAREFCGKLFELIPHKIDIGAVYNRPPRDKNKLFGLFIPTERELVFDIDLTDYDSIRNCCKEANVCSKCWRWITIATTILDELLRGHFGFKNLLWVFSGRRGVHCWVADRQARLLTSKAREAIAKYLIFDKKDSAINKYRVHPLAEQAFRIIAGSSEFKNLVLEQGWLETREQWSSVLQLCPDPDLTNKIDEAFQGFPSAQMRLEFLLKKKAASEENWNDGMSTSSTPNESINTFLRYFVLEYAYPRLDEKVTTGLNHLLKAPFTVHPKTGRIAVPLNPKNVGDIELSQLPRVDQLSMDMSTQMDKENANKRDKYCPALEPYIKIFEQFIEGID